MEDPKQVKTNTQQEIVKEKHKIIIETAVITIVVGLIAIGIFYAWYKIHQSADRVSELQNQISELQGGPGSVQVTDQSGNTPSPSETTDDSADIFSRVLSQSSSGGSESGQISAYEGWKTYTNYEVGYSLRYPSDWTVKETSDISEITNEPVKYIFIYSPGKKYVLHWGLRYKDDNFRVSDRTGIGVGDDKKDGTINILGEDITITRHVYDGKTIEIFYPSAGTEDILDGKWEMTASLNSDTDERDLKNADERGKAELILKSVRLIARDDSNACGESFSREEILNMADWQRYDSEKYGYTFLYPKEWNLANIAPDGIANADRSFQFISGRLASDDFSRLIIEKTENMKIDCLNAKISYISTNHANNNERDHAIVAQFENYGIKHMVAYLYASRGASLDSDLIEQFKTILKTIRLTEPEARPEAPNLNLK